MKKFLTGDGSLTFVSEEYDETYHSVTGAEEESVKKYAEPTKIADLAKFGKVRILDVCFGLGYNSAAAIDAILKSNHSCKIYITALELDKSLLDAVQEINSGFESYNLIKQLKAGVFQKGNLTINLIYGDALKTIDEVEGTFDVCFFDPFSPRKMPDFWSEDFFRKVGLKLRKGAVLATYSCATHVRLNLIRAGFDPKDGPCIGRKSPSTVAYKL